MRDCDLAAQKKSIKSIKCLLQMASNECNEGGMMMQKKQVIQFAVLLLVILALSGAYFGIRSYNSKQEAQRANQDGGSL